MMKQCGITRSPQLPRKRHDGARTFRGCPAGPQDDLGRPGLLLPTDRDTWATDGGGAHGGTLGLGNTNWLPGAASTRARDTGEMT